MALPLVQFHDDGSCTTCAKALAWLRTIDDPVAVVAVAGRYRTGKSFLLNHVLLRGQDAVTDTGASKSESGFPVGPTTQPCTKGLWLWPRAARTRADGPGGRPCHVLVIDTEGTGATNSNDTRDTRIFALALLLSSYFIYNSQGSIDEPALANLQVVTEVSRMVRVQAEEAAAAAPVAPWNAPSDESEDGGDQLSDFFPAFMWVVRDFVLEMQAEDGTALEEGEYLEEALRCGRGGAAKDEIRQALLRAFPQRDCATLVRPCNDESKLRRLNTMPEEELRPEFVEQAARLRAKALAAPPKTVHGQAVTGAMLAALCEAYAQSIAQGGAPVIETAWTYVCADQCRRARKEAIQMFDKGLAAAVSPATPPGERPSPLAPHAWPVRVELELGALRARALEAFRARAACAGDDQLMAEEEAALTRHVDAEAGAALDRAGAAWARACSVEWTYEGDEGIDEVIAAWARAMEPPPPCRHHPHAGAAYVHASRMRAGVAALRRAAARRARGVEEERARALRQLMEAQRQHQAEAQALRDDGARHQEACAALRSQLETRANDHRQALEAQQALTQKAGEEARQEAAAELAVLRTDLEARAAERQSRLQALTVEAESLRCENEKLQEAKQTQEEESAALARQLEACRGADERAAASDQAAEAARRRAADAEAETEAARQQMKSERETSEKQVQELAQTWEERHAQAAAAARQVQEQLRQRAEAAEEQLRKEQEAAEAAAAALQDARQGLAEAAARADQADVRYRETEHAHQAAMAELRARHSAAMARLHQERNQKDQERLERDMKQNEIHQDLKAQHSALQARQAESEGRLAEARTSLKRKRDEIQQLQSHKIKYDELKHQHKYLRASHEQIQQQHAALQKERGVAAAALEAAKREHLVAQSKLEIRCGTRDEKVRELEASRDTLRAQLETQTQEVQRLKRVFDSVKS